ncbi:MAG: helix-turn-helix transcriptional regulator [Candidatus Babeliaceae bacterium]|nr:helix-turn-helix transcriptional regulator [Candidatus Babeliaceae bacterium]
MPIVVRLDELMARRKMRLNELSSEVGITEANLSILKTGKARAIRFSTLDALCKVLECQPGDILAYELDMTENRLTGESGLSANGGEDEFDLEK